MGQSSEATAVLSGLGLASMPMPSTGRVTRVKALRARALAGAWRRTPSPISTQKSTVHRVMPASPSTPAITP